MSSGSEDREQLSSSTNQITVVFCRLFFSVLSSVLGGAEVNRCECGIMVPRQEKTAKCSAAFTLLFHIYTLERCDSVMSHHYSEKGRLFFGM